MSTADTNEETKPCPDCTNGIILHENHARGRWQEDCLTCDGTGILPADNPKWKQELETRLAAIRGDKARQTLDESLSSQPNIHFDGDNSVVEDLVNKMKPSQPDPAGQTFIQAIRPRLYAFARYIRHHQTTGYGGPDNQNTIESDISAIHEADREAYARQEVVKVLLQMKSTINMDWFDKHDHADWEELLNDTIKACKDGK